MKPELPLFWRVLGGAIFGGVGLYLLGLSLGIVDPGEGEVGAPFWLVGLSGAIFVLCAVMVGFGLMVSPERLREAPPSFRFASYAAIVAFLALLAIVFSWLWLSPDAGPFSASVSAFGEEREASEGEARLAFGGLAVLSYILIGAALFRAWRN